AIGNDLIDTYRVSRAFPLLPLSTTRTAIKMGLPGAQGVFDGLAVRVSKHADFAGRHILDDDGDEPTLVPFQLVKFHRFALHLRKCLGRSPFEHRTIDRHARLVAPFRDGPCLTRKDPDAKRLENASQRAP